MENSYKQQVALLIEILPIIGQYEFLALKGGTAINLFVRDMARLSVDIDLTYLPLEDRNTSLAKIADVLHQISLQIQKTSNNKYHVEKIVNKEKILDTLHIIGDDNIRVIVEVNHVVRGSVFGTEIRKLCRMAQNQFFTFCEMQTLSIADLYGSKICAALARHKPRDLFDVMILFQNEGITEQIRQAFIVYLASSNRPMHELLTKTPNLQNLEYEFGIELEGMAIGNNPISIPDLTNAMHRLINEILTTITDNERKFLMSIKLGQPNWSLLPIPGIDLLPGLQNKLNNINKFKTINPQKYGMQLDNLQKILNV